MTSYATPLDHALAVADNLSTRLVNKYLDGQREHGGRLWRKPVLAFAIEEIIDLPVYMLTLEEQLADVRRLLGLAMVGGNMTYVRQALDILETGNADGVAEEER